MFPSPEPGLLHWQHDPGDQRRGPGGSVALCARDLVEELLLQARWRTTEYDADNTVLTQIAEIDFVRGEWREQGLDPLRVIAVRSRERQGGKKLDDSELTVQVVFTNDRDSEARQKTWCRSTTSAQASSRCWRS
jgi:hypothetical protein